MPETQNRNSTLVRHSILWMIFFLVEAYAAANDGSNLFGKDGTYFKRVLIQFLLFPGQALVCYGTIYYAFPGILRKGLKVRYIAAIMLFCACSVVFQYLLFIFTGPYFNKDRQLMPVLYPEILSNALRHTLYYPILLYFLLMADYLINTAFRKQKEKQMLENESMKAELSLLKAQVQPHFLFNTLNNIYSLTHTQPQKGSAMTSKLSDLLHYMLTECSQPYVTLEKEIKLIEDYIAIQKIRYGDRLSVEIIFEGPTSGRYISPLLLIPLVENSFKYGVSEMLEHSWIKIHFKTGDRFFLFSISNSRPPISGTKQLNGKLGLKNVKNRLNLIYPSAHEFRIDEKPESYTVSFRIPVKDHTPGAETQKQSF